mmetsp:Transcript_26199/g.84599  ORF Transcript_26199/g.84599 Transcript_26199/m.84599 type:complete len:239 (-) Transcript_26199:218-934(-)
MGSATWSQIPSHAGWGEGGGDDARGEEESIRWGATLQSGGIVCLIVVKCRIQIQQLGVESLWRGYERPTVQKPSQIAADVGGAHAITVEQVPELPSLRAACRIEALPQSPDLRHPPPRGAWASGLDPVAPTAPGRAAEAGLGRHVLGRADDAELLGERASHPDANGRRVALAADGARLEAPRAVGEQQRPLVVLGPQPLHSLEQLRLALLPHQVHLPPPLPIYDVAVELEPPLALERP